MLPVWNGTAEYSWSGGRASGLTLCLSGFQILSYCVVSLAHTASVPSVWKLLVCATNGATQTYQKGPAKCIQALRMMLIGTSAHIHTIKVNLWSHNNSSSWAHLCCMWEATTWIRCFHGSRHWEGYLEKELVILLWGLRFLAWAINKDNWYGQPTNKYYTPAKTIGFQQIPNYLCYPMIILGWGELIHNTNLTLCTLDGILFTPHPTPTSISTCTMPFRFRKWSVRVY